MSCWRGSVVLILIGNRANMRVCGRSKTEASPGLSPAAEALGVRGSSEGGDVQMPTKGTGPIAELHFVSLTRGMRRGPQRIAISTGW